MILKSDHHAANYMLGLVPASAKPKDFLKAYSLKAIDVSTLQASSMQDARCYVYNACASFLGGLGSFWRQEAVWTVVKMYYTVFYLSRASLCWKGQLVFHAPKEAKGGHTQFQLKILPGASPEVSAELPSTHKLVANLFKRSGYPAFMGSLQIASEDPIYWLMQQREYWQYRSARFSDPDFPDVLAKLDPGKLSLLLETYSKDTSGVYLADESHALVSLPFRLLEWALDSHALLSPGVVDDMDLRYLRGRCRIGGQQLSVFVRMLDRNTSLTHGRSHRA